MHAVLALAERTDAPNDAADALSELAEVLELRRPVRAGAGGERARARAVRSQGQRRVRPAGGGGAAIPGNPTTLAGRMRAPEF